MMSQHEKVGGGAGGRDLRWGRGGGVRGGSDLIVLLYSVAMNEYFLGQTVGAISP